MLVLVASWPSFHLDPHFILILVASWSLFHLDSGIFMLVASWSILHIESRFSILLHIDLNCILIYVTSLSLLHLYPRCILILVAPWSSLYLDSRCILILVALVASWSTLQLYPRCMLILAVSWSSLHLDPRCILILVAPWSSLQPDPRCNNTKTMRHWFSQESSQCPLLPFPLDFGLYGTQLTCRWYGLFIRSIIKPYSSAGKAGSVPVNPKEDFSDNVLHMFHQ